MEVPASPACNCGPGHRVRMGRFAPAREREEQDGMEKKIWQIGNVIFMGVDISGIIDEFVAKYGFSRKRVITEIEKTFSIMLSRWYRMEVIALYSKGKLIVFGYVKSEGCYVQKGINFTSKNLKGWNTLKRLIKQNMARAASCEQYYLHRNAGTMGWGTVVKIVPGEKLFVHLESMNGLEVYANCPLAGIGIYERLNGNFAVGRKRAFGVKAIHPVTVNGVARISIELSRTVKHLPALLLTEQVRNRQTRIRCVKRFPGKKSFVISNRFVPKSMILKIEDELHEHIQVRYERKK